MPLPRFAPALFAGLAATAPAACSPIGVEPGATPPPASASAGMPTSCPANREQQLVELTNRHRARAGSPPLAVDLRLAAAARAHALDLGRTARGGHEGSDGSAPADRVERAGYPWTLVGENVATGVSSAGMASALWMDSPPHRANVLADGFRHIGVAYLDVPGSERRTWWVVVFGASDFAPLSPDDGCHPPTGASRSGGREAGGSNERQIAITATTPIATSRMRVPVP